MGCFVGRGEGVGFDINYKTLHLHGMHAIIAQAVTSVIANQQNPEEKAIPVSSCFFLVQISPLP